MKTKQHLSVTWADHNWEVPLRKRPQGGCRMDREILRLVRSRFEPLSLPPNMYRPVSSKSGGSRVHGFTLIELLVVIAIIAILAGIILPTLASVKTRAKVANARTEMQGLVAAIKSYEADYNRYPATQLTEATAGTGDFTYGNINTTPPQGAPPLDPFPVGGNTNNSVVALLLLDIDQGINLNHVRNIRKNKYWNAKMVSNDAGGVSTVDYIARDPWGSPYIITVDMNDDNKCVDAFYGESAVSQRTAGDNVGYKGLSRPNPTAKFELNGPVMIWSPGPDKGYDIKANANSGLNKDNILSWTN